MTVIVGQLAGCTTYYPDADYDVYNTRPGQGRSPEGENPKEYDETSTSRRDSAYKDALYFMGEDTILIGGAIIAGVMIAILPFWIGNAITND